MSSDHIHVQDLLPHPGLNILHFFGQPGGQIHVIPFRRPIFPDHKIVLYPDPLDLCLVLVKLVPVDKRPADGILLAVIKEIIVKVDAWFVREDHIFVEFPFDSETHVFVVDPVVFLGGVSWEVVGVDSDVVSESVGEEVEGDSGLPDLLEVFLAVDGLADDAQILETFHWGYLGLFIDDG